MELKFHWHTPTTKVEGFLVSTIQLKISHKRNPRDSIYTTRRCPSLIPIRRIGKLKVFSSSGHFDKRKPGFSYLVNPCYYFKENKMTILNFIDFTLIKFNGLTVDLIKNHISISKSKSRFYIYYKYYTTKIFHCFLRFYSSHD